MYIALVLKLVLIALFATIVALVVKNVWMHVMITMSTLPQF